MNLISFKPILRGGVGLAAILLVFASGANPSFWATGQVNTNQNSWSGTVSGGTDGLTMMTEKQKQVYWKRLSSMGIDQLYAEERIVQTQLSRPKLSVRNRKIFEEKKQMIGELIQIRNKDINDAAAWGTVICTELTRQWFLTREVLKADGAFADKYISDGTLTVYHFWAKPIVRLMQESKLVTEIVAPYGTAWAHHMAYEMGSMQEDDWLGYEITNTLLPIHEKVSSFLLNDTATKEPRAKNWAAPSPSLGQMIQLGILYWILIALVALPMGFLCLLIRFATLNLGAPIAISSLVKAQIHKIFTKTRSYMFWVGP